jgi:hypothetical protein
LRPFTSSSGVLVVIISGSAMRQNVRIIAKKYTGFLSVNHPAQERLLETESIIGGE